MHFCHVEKQLLPFLYLIVQEPILKIEQTIALSIDW